MRIFVGGLIALLAIVAAGCGNGGGGTTEAALTKTQFIKRGDAICHAAQVEREKALAAWRRGGLDKGKALHEFSLEELDDVYLSDALPPIKEASNELAALSPAGDAKAENLVETLVSTVEAIEEKPTRALKEYPYEKVDKLAKAYGFKSCSLL